MGIGAYESLRYDDQLHEYAWIVATTLMMA
jgi:hypothetical protein